MDRETEAETERGMERKRPREMGAEDDRDMETQRET